jgi:hypothetical protein
MNRDQEKIKITWFDNDLCSFPIVNEKVWVIHTIGCVTVCDNEIMITSIDEGNICVISLLVKFEND